MAGNIGDGTGRDCFDTYGGGKNKDGNGRDGKIMKIVVGWMGQDGTMGVKFRTGTERYSAMTFFLVTGRDGEQTFSRRDGTIYIFFFPRRDGTVPSFVRRKGTCMFFHLDMTCST